MDPRVGVPLSVKFDLDVHEHDSDVTIGSIGICPAPQSAWSRHGPSPRPRFQAPADRGSRRTPRGSPRGGRRAAARRGHPVEAAVPGEPRARDPIGRLRRHGGAPERQVLEALARRAGAAQRHHGHDDLPRQRGRRRQVHAPGQALCARIRGALHGRDRAVCARAAAEAARVGVEHPRPREGGGEHH
eukprot:scaffold13882_cov63-Phaeocystis_antarctica.AAC.4